MSSQKGNVLRSRSQKHRNVTAFKNDKYDDSQRTKKINSKLHDGVCQRCKDVLEWRVKYSKFKPLSQPKKCVKCLQKTVKNAYHIICKPCAIQLELCAKCGKKEDIVLPLLYFAHPVPNMGGRKVLALIKPNKFDTHCSSRDGNSGPISWDK
uniref:Chromosome 9 open reading frame 85 n=1 Tax=Leptobrachium leishanense TaxID=445787 RepID=A0A8C5PS89_9ANUR